MTMLIYVSHWSTFERDPEAIIDCDPWVDEEHGLVLHLKRKTSGTKVQHMAVALDRRQLEEIIKLARDKGLLPEE